MPKERILDDRPWGAHVATADSRAVPQVFFTDPEAASVGLTTDAGRSSWGTGSRRSTSTSARPLPGANFYADGYTGARSHRCRPRPRTSLLGATFVGPGVAELLHSATIAVAARVPIDRLWHAVPCFPTISEVWLRLMEANRDTTTAATASSPRSRAGGVMTGTDRMPAYQAEPTITRR